eukprot:763590-Hanusia_phi.AAC.5
MVGRPDKEHVAEYAKSGRASCRKCKGNIAKDTLRMGKYVQSPSFDGWVPQWFHVACFFGGKKAMPDVSDIAGISELSFDDQKRIKDLIGGNAVASGELPVSLPPSAYVCPFLGLCFRVALPTFLSQPAKKGQGGTKGAEDDEGNIGDYKVTVCGCEFMQPMKPGARSRSPRAADQNAVAASPRSKLESCAWGESRPWIGGLSSLPPSGITLTVFSRMGYPKT